MNCTVRLTADSPNPFREHGIPLCYCHVMNGVGQCFPCSDDDQNHPKYSLSAIIPKDNGELVEKVRKAIDAAIEDGKARKWGGVIPEKLMLPLHDGDEEKPEDEAYANSFFLNANSDEAPHIVDRHVKPINDPKEVYSGFLLRTWMRK